mmetsp:Transcript_5243/g.10469  ORF Transcript_5243/g.10469 Transcript_5243/m.10469 type:complete len:464 (+) Transcript_5243:109-1500(+)|eukprot:CAMPEP_0118663222 /NCGR_PEP_ID=MMETSP0785-20121206/17291_1 /TAXON_ID=91992 /ORGANISM="Bolidomonas pacifica, Strain CCMP 1866" /LENGTH=463 /DNA_ID=CAMNT_0006556901 /DNA_START=30 /DNA_END=1421 /DNA_ORIENTATION=-
MVATASNLPAPPSTATAVKTIPQAEAIRALVARRLVVPAESLEDQPHVFAYDLDAYRANLAKLRSAFAPHWHHATAVKTNPVAKIMKIGLAEGHGAECASIGEVIHSLKMGFAGPDIVYDSPCKTIPEIKYALENKVMLNIDNLQELERVKVIVESMTEEQLEGCVIGLRINPLVGFGAVANLSVSTRKSKFGVLCPVGASEAEKNEREPVLKALVEYDFINAVHVHTGSGGMTLSQMADGAAGAANVALEVNTRRSEGQKKIHAIDIGGGLPVTWGGNPEPTYEQYAAVLREKAPSLFDGTFSRVVTEMGAKNNCMYGLYASVVEVTKPTDSGKIAMIHAGSDQFLRACYAPHMRKPFPPTVYSPDGSAKTGETVDTDIAGPLCFAGDIVVAGASLPDVQVGDIVVLGEAGGNTSGMRTTHCSRRTPPIFGYERGDDGNGDGLKFVQLSKGSTFDEVLKNWD